MRLDPVVRDRICQAHRNEINRVLFCTDVEQVESDIGPTERSIKRIEYLSSLRKGAEFVVPDNLKTTQELIAQIQFNPRHDYHKVETVEALVELTHRLGIRHDTLAIYWWWHMYGNEPMPSSLLPSRIRLTPFWS